MELDSASALRKKSGPNVNHQISQTISLSKDERKKKRELLRRRGREGKRKRSKGARVRLCSSRENGGIVLEKEEKRTGDEPRRS